MTPGETGALPAASRRADERTDILLVCSPGGHLLQLHWLRPAWQGFSRVWVTLDKSDARSLLAGERVIFAHGPTNRNLWNLVRNLGQAAAALRRIRPKVVMTTGAGVAVPFAWIGRLLGARVVYVESLTRIERPSLSCRLIRPVASRIYVQWPDLLGAVPEAHYAGNLFFDR